MWSINLYLTLLEDVDPLTRFPLTRGYFLTKVPFFRVFFTRRFFGPRFHSPEGPFDRRLNLPEGFLARVTQCIKFDQRILFHYGGLS